MGGALGEGPYNSQKGKNKILFLQQKISKYTFGINHKAMVVNIRGLFFAENQHF